MVSKNIAIHESDAGFLEESFTETISTIKGFGVRYIELALPIRCKELNKENVGEFLEKQGIQVACVFTWTRLNVPEKIKQKQQLILDSIELASKLGAKVVDTFFGPNPDRDKKTAIREYKKNILPCLEKAEEKSITICLENEFDKTGTDITRRATDTIDLLEEIDSEFLRITFDPCNFYVAGEEPYPYAYRVLKDYIGHIHIKDAVKYNKNLYGGEDKIKGDFIRKDASGEYIFVPLGEGGINYPAFLKALKKDGYDGFLTLEPHLKPQYRDKTIEQSIRVLTSFL